MEMAEGLFMMEDGLLWPYIIHKISKNPTFHQQSTIMYSSFVNQKN